MPLDGTNDYVTAGPWGPGKGVPHTVAEADAIFATLDTDLQASVASIRGTGVDTITRDAGDYVFTLTDVLATELRFPEPTPLVQFLGEWQPNSAYSAGSILRVTGVGVVYVMLTHTSAATFAITAAVSGFQVYALVYPDLSGGALVTTAATTYELTPGEGYIRFTASGAVTVTVPEVESFAPAADVMLRQAGTGGITVTPGGVTTLNGVAGKGLTTANQGSVVRLKKVEDGEWDVWGDLV